MKPKINACDRQLKAGIKAYAEKPELRKDRLPIMKPLLLVVPLLITNLLNFLPEKEVIIPERTIVWRAEITAINAPIQGFKPIMWIDERPKCKIEDRIITCGYFDKEKFDWLKIKNEETIKKLIKCESNYQIVSRPDSDGIISDGILQFHRGKDDTIETGTWGEWSRESGIQGDPMNPVDAIIMADWAISKGRLNHWSCAYITGLLKR